VLDAMEWFLCIVDLQYKTQQQELLVTENYWWLICIIKPTSKNWLNIKFTDTNTTDSRVDQTDMICQMEN
jgi:hypothetical protein